MSRNLLIALAFLSLFFNCQPFRYPSLFFNHALTITDDAEVEHHIILKSDGTIAGDSDFLFTVYGWVQADRKFERWERDGNSQDTILFIPSGRLRNIKAHLFKDTVVFEADLARFAKYRHFKMSSDFSAYLQPVNLEDYYSRDQLAFLSSAKRVRYVSSMDNPPLYTGKDPSSPILARMNFTDKFIEMEPTGKADDQWVQGYWRCIRGWTLKQNLSRSRPEWGEWTEQSREAFRLYHEGGTKGFFVNLNTNIHELPSTDSRVIANGRMLDLVEVHVPPPAVQSDWVYIDTPMTATPVGQMKNGDPVVGCVDKNEIGSFDRLERVTSFIDQKIDSWQGDAGTRYEFARDGSCRIRSLPSPYSTEADFGVFHVYKYKNYYALIKGEAIWTGFRFVNGKICNLGMFDTENHCETNSSP